jgi:hypothetical protein
MPAIVACADLKIHSGFTHDPILANDRIPVDDDHFLIPFKAP